MVSTTLSIHSAVGFGLDGDQLPVIANTTGG